MEDSQHPMPTKRAATLRVKNTLARLVHVGGVTLLAGQVGEVPNDVDGVNERDIESFEGLEIDRNAVFEAQREDCAASLNVLHRANTVPAIVINGFRGVVDPARKGVAGRPSVHSQWSIDPRARFDSLAQAIYDTLQAELTAGRKRPSASGLLALWRQNKPPCVVRFKADGVDWFGGEGGEETADRKTLSDRIYRMTKITR